jgi:AcrR family transcriptional regulator
MEKGRAERELILRAAYRTIGRDAGAPAPVHEILQEAGLSTRAFYRHFRSKDELVVTMYRTAAERVAEELSDAAARAPGPAAALEAWIRHHLAVVYDPRRARQTGVLTSAEVRAADGYDQARQDDATVRRTMLAEVIRAGQRAGVFPASTDADEDARAVLSVVGGLIEARLAGAATPTWADAARHTTDLFLRAFGARP